jgi:hypothetical protein
MLFLDHSPINSDPQLTRVPAQTLTDYIDGGFSVVAFLEMFHSVKATDALAFLRLTRKTDYAPHIRRDLTFVA